MNTVNITATVNNQDNANKVSETSDQDNISYEDLFLTHKVDNLIQEMNKVVGDIDKRKDELDSAYKFEDEIGRALTEDNQAKKSNKAELKTWSVDQKNNKIFLDGYSIELNKKHSEWIIRKLDADGNAIPGQASRIWGDPHVDEDNDGKTDWDFLKQTSFVLADGTKISVGTKDFGNNWTVSDTLTITKQDQCIRVTGLAQNDKSTKLKISKVTLDGRKVDAETRDGWIAIEGEKGLGEWVGEDGEAIDKSRRKREKYAWTEHERREYDTGHLQQPPQFSYKISPEMKSFLDKYQIEYSDAGNDSSLTRDELVSLRENMGHFVLALEQSLTNTDIRLSFLSKELQSLYNEAGIDVPDYLDLSGETPVIADPEPPVTPPNPTDPPEPAPLPSIPGEDYDGRIVEGIISKRDDYRSRLFEQFGEGMSLAASPTEPNGASDLINEYMVELESTLAEKHDEYSAKMNLYPLGSNENRFYRDLTNALVADRAELEVFIQMFDPTTSPEQYMPFVNDYWAEGAKYGNWSPPDDAAKKVLFAWNNYVRLTDEAHLEHKYNANIGVGRMFDTDKRTDTWYWMDNSFFEQLDKNLGLMGKEFTVDNPMMNNLAFNAYLTENTGTVAYNIQNGMILVDTDSVDTIIHETAHDFDDENPNWDNWLSLSGWKRVPDTEGTYIPSQTPGWMGEKVVYKGHTYSDGDTVDTDDDGVDDKVIKAHYNEIWLHDIIGAEFMNTVDPLTGYGSDGLVMLYDNTGEYLGMLGEGDPYDLDLDGTSESTVRIDNDKKVYAVHNVSGEETLVMDIPVDFPNAVYNFEYSATHPVEDFANTFYAFHVWPDNLKAQVPEKYEWMANYTGYDPLNT